MAALNQKTWYRILQGAGWGSYFLFGLLMMSVYSSELLFRFVVNQAVITLVLFGLSHGHRNWLKKRKLLEKASMPAVAGRLVLNSLLLSVVAQFLITPVLLFIVEQPGTAYSFTHSIGYVANTFMVLMVWALLYAGIKLVIRQRQMEIDRWKLEAELKNAELLQLREQVNPHFIFNALNNIRSLVTENPERARDAITRLSNLIRSSLLFRTKHLIPLEDELQLVRDYLELELIQLEDRLSVHWDTDEPLHDKLIPAMTLQILVENAIKHGVANRKQGGRLQITIKGEPAGIRIIVTNPGSLKPNGRNGTGLGLQNIRQRLQKLSDGRATLHITDTNDQVVAEVWWPDVPPEAEPLPHQPYESSDYR